VLKTPPETGIKKSLNIATVRDRACRRAASGRFCSGGTRPPRPWVMILLSVTFCSMTGSTALAGVQLVKSSSSGCVFQYSPAEPVLQEADTVNPRGMRIEWPDASIRVCESVLQAVRIFYVALPPGTTPQLRIRSVRTEPLGFGLAGRPPEASVERSQPGTSWADLSQVEWWRGFRLARIEVPLQVGDLAHSDVLRQIEIEVVFSGSGRQAATPRDTRLLSRMAVNGAAAATWWELPSRRSTLDDVGSWPSYDLARLAVTETGLYQVVGSSVMASGLVGQPSAKIKLFGNGGRLLPIDPAASTDTALIEDAIWVLDGGDGRFDRQDTILFFARGVKGVDYCDGSYLQGQAHQSPFTTENVYFLGVDPSGANGKRMAPLATAGDATSVTTSVVHVYLEQDVYIYSGGSQPESGLIWYMSTLDAGQERSFIMNLEGATGRRGKLTFHGRYDGDIRNQFTIYLGTTAFPVATSVVPVTFIVPDSAVGLGNNLIRLVNGSSATIHVNYIEIQYERTISAPFGSLEFFAPDSVNGVFRYTIPELSSSSYFLNVTNPLEPRLAMGNTVVDSTSAARRSRYFAVRSNLIRTPTYRGATARHGLDYVRLRDPSNSADMIILTFDEGYDLLDSLRAFHEVYREQPLRTMRVRLTDVYDEFGWGVHDVVAIRNFLKYAFESWQPTGTGEPLQYVLLVGDGDYDYRNIISSADANWMPPWEYGEDCRDDFFTIFRNGSDLPSCMTGRWPVQGVGELQGILSKTIAYADHPFYGPWKNTATFAADDEWKGPSCGETSHTTQAESLINTVLPDYFTFKKIYEILYPFRSTATGATKPDATRDLIETINRGTLIVNYTGHGNERVWTDEQMFVMDRDRNLLDNWRMWPLFLAATCTWGGFDRPIGRCFPEVLLADPSDGGIVCVAATRFTYVGSNNAFTNAYYHELFRPGLAARSSFGEALMVAKAAFNTNAAQYHTLGDPVLRLATPEYFARVTQRDDSLRALSVFHLAGEVSQTDSGSVWSDFQGVVEARVYDTEDSAAYYWCNNTSSPPFYYKLPGNAIFRGRASVRNGGFDISFRVPRDVRPGGTDAKISLYFFGRSASGADSADGIGIQEGLAIASVASAEEDTIPPNISVWLETASFRSGDVVSSSPRLHVDLTDSSGVNLSGEVGHKITARVDDAQAEDLTPYFNYDLDSHTRGSLEKIIGPLAEGEHQLILEAWDSFNNLNRASLTFAVGQSGEAGYAIRDVYAWPNPMKDVTHFTYYLTQAGTRRVSLKIFTLSGKLVFEMGGLDTRGPAFNSNADQPWNGRDREGHLLANGVYLYRVKAEHTDGHTAESTGKLVILR
jgi:hypothetical protein